MSEVNQQVMNRISAAAGQVSNFCAELFRRTPISWFGYARFYRNRDFLLTMSDASVQEDYLMNEHYMLEFSQHQFDDMPNNGAFFANLLTSTPEEVQLHLDVREKFGLSNFIGIFRKNDHYVDIYNFAADVENGDLPNFYLNNMYLLQKYVDVFQDPLRKIVRSNNIERVHVPYHGLEQIAEVNDYTEFSLPDIISNTILSEESNVPSLKTSDMVLGRLTQRELDCLRWIVRGYTSKEVGRKLGLSFRTVENYCERIKTKLGCRRKQDIIVRYANAFVEESQVIA